MDAKRSNPIGATSVGNGGAARRLGRGLGQLIPTQPPNRERLPAAPDRSSRQASDGGDEVAGSSASIAADVGKASHAVRPTVEVPNVPRGTPRGVSAVDPSESLNSIVEIAVDAIAPNRHQPREDFNDQLIAELAESIKSAGLLQPITVRPVGSSSPPRYELIAGERRWRAAKLIGWERIPAIVRTASDRESAQYAVVENVQRSDLNPVERAFAIRSLGNDFGLTHQQISDAVGLDRATVSNLVRLTELDSRTLDLVRQGRLSAGHARALLGIREVPTRSLLADTAIMEEWSVRVLEREVQRSADRAKSSGVSRGTSAAPVRSAHISNLESSIGRALGTRVHIQLGRKKGAGRMTIEFFSLEQFDGLLRKLGVEDAAAQ